ncbi:MAG: ATP-binding protein, partial [Treponema sp.]|nr:ATP-binding protein [Treponema sp.]
LNHAGLGYGDIQTLYIAGGFGFNLNPESGAGIGLIPEALRSKVSLIGNSALGGTIKYLLNPDYEKTLAQIAGQSEEFSLPSDKYFNNNFIKNTALTGADEQAPGGGPHGT